MSRLLSASLLLCLISVTLVSAASDWQCTTPTFSNGPLPPVLPDSYYMAFEVIDVIGKKRHASEVWYDWQSQRARVRSVDETGVRRELVVFYNFDYAFQYMETKPDSPVEDANRVFTCEFFDLSSRKNTPFVEKDDQPLKMVDVYQSLLFGGKYPYAFVSRTADRESRFIDTNKFSTCITDRITGRRLNVTYLWTRDGERPIRFEIDGGLPNSDGEPELRVHQVASVIRFERDPKMDVELFTVPRDIHCRNDPRTGTNNFPLLSPDFTWREEVLNYARDDNNVLLRDQITLRHRELWSSQIFRLARMDWTPTAEDGKTFEPFIGKAISVIADVDYRALFIVQTNTGQCKIVPLNKDFTLVNEGENDSFFLREPLDLLGMTKEHVNKGEHFERGSRVSVYTRLDDVDSATRTITIHEMSFRVDQALLNRTNGAYGFVPLSQVSRKLLPTPDEKTRAYERTEQISYFKVQSDYVHLEKFEAPACIAHHKRRMFQIGFKTDFKDVIYGNGYEFLNRLRDIIARTGNLGTIMRVQKLEMFEDHVQDRIFVKMVLLEPLPEIVGAINTTVDEARDAIVEALDNYQLAVPIEWEGTSNTIVPEAGSFVEIGQVQIEPFHPRLLRAEMFSARIEVTSKYFSSVNLAVMCVCVFLVGVTAGFSGLALRRTLVRK